MRNLITAQEVIDLAFAENSNMMAESISDTAIRIAEIKYIRPAFGVMYPLLADKYADFANDYVKPALAYFVKCEIVSSIAIDMSNSGVAVANPQYQSAATDKQRQRLYDSEMSKAKTLLDFALEYIATHSELFPDFSGEAPKKHHRVGGILLGGGTSRSQSASIAGEAFKNEIERLSKQVAGKVDKIEGKGLSTNDYTDEDKAKVNDIGENTIIVDYDRIKELKNSEEGEGVTHPEIAELVEKIYNEQEKLILVRHFANTYEQLDPTYFVPDTNYGRDEFGDVIITLFASYTPTYNTYGEQSLIGLEVSITQAGAIIKVEQTNVTLLNEDSVIDNLNSASSNRPLSARQGVMLNRNKQDKLTLSTKENGNIEISGLSSEPVMFMPATPSGDPMHDVYMSYYGVSYNPDTNLYSLGYLTNLTADDMRKAFVTYGGGVMSVAYNSNLSSYALNSIVKNDLPRTTLPQRTVLQRIYYDKVRFHFTWVDLEQIFIGVTPPTPDVYNTVNIWQYNSTEMSFQLIGGLQKLKYIVDVLYCNMSHALTMFNQLPALQEVRLIGLKGNVAFSQSSNLSKESLLYMINNCATAATFTITLHPTVYTKCVAGGEWHSDMQKALDNAQNNKSTTITLASA